ncbi:hypothetical protein Q5P01_001625 [Channa striata]|uniref:Uncharacterized protein n=1 Tax=Channa striata TaxID=64152 RepID=A0AA88NND1_CHASR|nr:hypothetical protein Q5P01_001625 [Channa striata]
MTHQNSPAEVELTCYYTVKFRGGQYQSPHSNISSITITSDDERKPRTTESMQTFTVVTGKAGDNSSDLCFQQRTQLLYGKTSYKRSQSNTAGDFMSMRNIDQEGLLPAGNNGCSVITSVPAAECHTDSEKLKDKDSQNGESDTYHMYATIPEEPAASVLKNPMYRTLQAH